jgi:hypothetical protein
MLEAPERVATVISEATGVGLATNNLSSNLRVAP